MQTITLEPQILISSSVRIDFGTISLENKGLEKNRDQLNLFKSLPEKGLDCLTNAKIEHILCTSALCAHI